MYSDNVVYQEVGGKEEEEVESRIVMLVGILDVEIRRGEDKKKNSPSERKKRHIVRRVRS